MLNKVTGSVTETVVEGFGQRLMKSVVGVLVGIVLFFGSFAVLWWNEGNVVEEKAALDEMKKAVVKTDAKAPNKAHQGKLVHASAKLESPEKLGDAPYLVAGSYLALDREVEMFQWVEEEEKSTETSTGGSKKTTTTYSYELKWASGVEDSSKFKNPSGHQNPPLKVEVKAQKVRKATFGKMDGMEVVNHLSASGKLAVTKAMLPPKSTHEIKEGMIYQRVSAKAKVDQLGDVRISYQALKPGVFSVMAKQKGKTFEAYTAKNGKDKFLVFAGSKSPQSMFQSEKDSAKTFAMVMRFVGFLVMFVGMSLMGGPISTLLDFIPMIGTAGRFVMGVVFFVASAVLSATTIVLAMIANNPIALAAFVLALAGGGYFLYQKKKNKPVAFQQQAAPQTQAPHEKRAA